MMMLLIGVQVELLVEYANVTFAPFTNGFILKVRVIGCPALAVAEELVSVRAVAGRFCTCMDCPLVKASKY